MISLHGRATDVHLLKRLNEKVFRLDRVTHSSLDIFSLNSNHSGPGMRQVYLVKDESDAEGLSEFIVAPSTMSYLKDGDIVSLSSDGLSISTLWRGNGVTNTFLLTERCDNFCLMCSQPPRERNDDWLIQQAFEVVSLMPKDAVEIGITGGEPTLYGSHFNELVRHITSTLPTTALHILSNGRKFSDWDFALEYSGATNDSTMVGIPIYGSESKLHDYVVQAEGAFHETVNGILNLGELDQAIELRVVLHAQTTPALIEIAEFITRNLPFVDQVALMGLEMMGFARKNQDLLWIDPAMYQEDLAEATEHLVSHGVHTMIYNHQLCLLHRDIWKYAVQSISDWKNEYDALCTECDVLERCGGFFHSAKYGSSSSITPLDSEGFAKSKVFLDLADQVMPKTDWSRRLIPVTAVDWAE